MARILYVDDERAIGRAVQTWMTRKGVELRRSHSLAGAMKCLTKYAFDGAFIDLWLGDGSGFALYDHIRDHYPELASRVAFVTGDTVPRAEVAAKLRERGCPVVNKPFDLSELETWVEVWSASAARAARPAAERAPLAHDGDGDGHDSSPPTP